LGSDTTKILDKGSVEYIGPYGLELSLVYTGKKAAKLDSGIVTSYALYILSGLILYIFI
jgi:NADH-ubiquinone oxidoreductase chain 5